MADLEELGLVASPHTSAGRIPTVQGYRFFVDSLLTTLPLRESVLRHVERQLNPEIDSHELIKAASVLLSKITHLAGVVTFPRREHTILRHIEFLPLADNRVLVILIVNDHEVQNRVIFCSRPYPQDKLKQAANYLNEQFAGKEIIEVKKALIDELRATKDRADQIMSAAISIANEALEMDTEEGDYVLAGQTNLMDYAEMSDMDRLRIIFDSFNEKREILRLLEQVIEAEGVQIFIGEESGHRVFDGCSMVTSPYSVNEQVVGSLGVIGPTRMAYNKVIPVVDVTAKLLGAALNQ